jgi:hypothetical protein
MVQERTVPSLVDRVAGMVRAAATHCNPGAGRSWLTVLIVATALFALAPRDAHAAKCGSTPGDDDAVAAFVADVRAACPCDGFPTRAAYRRCVRDRVKSAVGAGALPARCRATVNRFANRSTCGKPAGAVTCCAIAAGNRDVCTILRTDVACRAWRGGRGQVGSSESCHDACAPAPTATPTPTVTPTPSGPFGLGPRCMCRCFPVPSPWPANPYAPNGCPSFHWCVVMTSVPTGSADCEALSDGDDRGCVYTPDAPIPGDPNGPVVDACNF